MVQSINKDTPLNPQAVKLQLQISQSGNIPPFRNGMVTLVTHSVDDQQPIGDRIEGLK